MRKTGSPRICELAIWAFAVAPVPGWPADCSHHAQSLEGLSISSIEIDNRNIFDTDSAGENLWIHRVANMLHIKTRKKTIDELILIEQGQAYSERLVRETERLIRSQDYIHDARIEAEPICGEGVRLKVISTDNWTLTPSIAVGHSGGETRTTFEFQESNLLGTGTSIKLKSDSDEDRDENSITYKDSNWLGGHKYLRLNFSDNSDGYLYDTRLARPYYQLDERYTWSAQLSAHKLERPVYTESELTDKIGQIAKNARFSYGWSDGLIGDSVERFHLGWAFSDNDYFRTEDFPVSEIPDSRFSSFPFVGYSLTRPEYLTRTNFLVMGVNEDIAIGYTLDLEFGWQDKAFGSDERAISVGIGHRFGSQLTDRTLGFVDLSLNYVANTESEDTGRFSLGGRLYYYRNENHSYLLNGAIETALNAEEFELYVVGGDNGLKGYPIRYQKGDNRAILAIEDRFFFDWYPLKLLKFGAAVFAETGSAWLEDDGPRFISDAGFGLRVVSTRQSHAKVLHADIAFPLSERDRVDSYQFFLKAQAQF